MKMLKSLSNYIYSVVKMTLLLLLLVTVFGRNSISVYSQTTATVIEDYLRVNNLKTVLLISCVNQTNVRSMETISTLQHRGIWFNIWDISNENELSIANPDYDNFFIRLSNAHCVVVDLDCKQAAAFMKVFSKRILFHYERNWLIFSSDFNKSFDILSQQNINVDAEVSLVIPGAADDYHQSYEIFEVYNPSAEHGGRLNVTRIGHWSESTGLSLPLKQTKIERRRNLQGITLTSVITVSQKKKRNLKKTSFSTENLFLIAAKCSGKHNIFATPSIQ